MASLRGAKPAQSLAVGLQLTSYFPSLELHTELALLRTCCPRLNGVTERESNSTKAATVPFYSVLVLLSSAYPLPSEVL